MRELIFDEVNEVDGGVIRAIAIAGYFALGGYAATVDFVSGAIEGFVEAGE